MLGNEHRQISIDAPLVTAHSVKARDMRQAREQSAVFTLHQQIPQALIFLLKYLADQNNGEQLGVAGFLLALFGQLEAS
jgi:hypothetical protein